MRTRAALAAVVGRSRRPDFLGIGAQKAGTTWLYQNLARHPRLWLPREKELHYFDEKRSVAVHPLPAKARGHEPRDHRWRRQVRGRVRAYRRRRPTAGQLAWDARYFLGRPDDRWYLSLFGPAGDRVTGDITPDYALLDHAQLTGVRTFLPEAKLLYFLRNPIERAWSHAMMETRMVQRPFSEEDLRRQFRRARARAQSDYLGALDRWGAHYPAERIFVGFLDDVHFRPAELLDAVCAFLGVEPIQGPHAPEVVHSGSIPTLPARLAADLARLYEPLTAALAERFGRHARWWRWCAQRLTEQDGGVLPYPFLGTELWTEWLAAQGLPQEHVPPLASGTLASRQPRVSGAGRRPTA